MKPKPNLSRPKIKRQTAAGHSPWWRQMMQNTGDWYADIALFTLAFLVYGRTIGFDFSLDDHYISNQLAMADESWRGLWSVFQHWYAGNDYRPVTVLSFWLERKLFGGFSPASAHFVNTLLFAYLLTRIYKLIQLMRCYTDPAVLQAFALLSCLIFLVHPEHVSVVANIKSRDNLLSMLFGVLFSIRMLKAYDEDRYIQVLPAALFIFLGMLSKLDCYVFFAFPALSVFFFRENSAGKKWKLLFLLIALFVLLAALWLFMEHLFLDPSVRMKNFSDPTESPLAGNDSLYHRFCMALTTLLYYLKFQVLPWGYYFYFGYDQIPLRPFAHPQNLAALLLLIGLLAAAVWMYNKNRIYLFAYLFFLAALAYTANFFIVIPGILMDRYAFIASLGFSMALSALLIDIARIRDWRFYRSLPVCCILLVYAGFTVYRSSAWRNKFSLIERDIAQLDRSVNAQRIASVTYIKAAFAKGVPEAEGRQYIAQAEGYADKALAVYDRSALAWEAKGICNLYKGDNVDALGMFHRCMQLDSTYLSGINYIGVAFRNLDNTDSAYYYFNYVMQRETKFGYSADNLVQLLLRRNRRREADSLIDELNHRFPEDAQLKARTAEWEKDESSFSEPH